MTTTTSACNDELQIVAQKLMRVWSEARFYLGDTITLSHKSLSDRRASCVGPAGTPPPPCQTDE